MPDETTAVLVIIPINLVDTLPNFVDCMILVTAQHLQSLILVICNGVISNYLMSHRNGEKIRSYALPVIYFVIVVVCPMEVETRRKVLALSRVSEVESFFWSHGNEYLNQGEDSMAKDSFMGIFLYLIDRLSYVNTRTFQFNMDDRHTIDEQHHIATSCCSKWMFGLKSWLTNYLIYTLSCTNFLRIKDFQIDLFAVVSFIFFVIAFDLHQTSIDKLVHLIRVL